MRHHSSAIPIDRRTAPCVRPDRSEPDIEWRYCERIEPGEYPAFSRSATVYRDREFQRFVCAVQFDILDEARISVIAHLTWYMNLGSRNRPHAGRRGNYWRAWIKANRGRLPVRKDRLSPRVFAHRHARVIVADTERDFQGVVNPESVYSVVRDVSCWETG